MSIAIGIDAGGTSTTAIASIDGKTSESITLGPANFAVDFNSAIATVKIAIEQVRFGKDVASIVIGAAGAGDKSIRTRIRRELSAYDSCEVYADTHVALRAAVPEGDGIVLIAGTGSIAYAEIGGEIFRAGGHGYAFGDEGSGFAIGKSALQLLARATDGRVPRDAFIEEIAVAVPNMREFYALKNPAPTIARLAPIVLAAANRGERSASRIIQSAALDLANLLKRMPGDQQELPLVLAGGLFRENSLLTYLLETRIANEWPLWHVIKNPPPPYIGALRLAEKMHAG